MFVLPFPVCTMVGSRFNALASHYHQKQHRLTVYGEHTLDSNNASNIVPGFTTLANVPSFKSYHRRHRGDCPVAVIGLQINHCANNNSTFVYWKSTRVHRYYTFVFSIIFLCPAGPCLSRSPPVWCVIAEDCQCSTVALKLALRNAGRSSTWSANEWAVPWLVYAVSISISTDGRSQADGRKIDYVWTRQWRYLIPFPFTRVVSPNDRETWKRPNLHN